MERTLRPDAFVWTLGSLCRLHRLAFDARLLMQHFVPPYRVAALQQAAETLGLEARFKRTRGKGFGQHDLPCVAFEVVDEPPADAPTAGDDPGASDPTNAEPQPSGGAAVSPALIIKVDGDRVLYFPAGRDQPQTISRQDFRARFEPVILCVKAAPGAVPDDEVDRKPREFGFRWFIPELLRHKGIWRDVLLASLTIQLLGLTTPLFTQVVIDKVIVHHTMNTLLVIGNTGQRIDGVLGSRVFQHLLELPLRYYEHRSTGTLVARLQGVETIRGFITGAAVSLFLDLPFLGLFLAVMLYYSWQLTLMVAAILAVISVLSLSITPLLRRRLNQQFLLGARNQAFLTEYVSGMETVKSLQMEPQLKHRFGEYLSQYLASAFDTRRLSNSYSVAANTLEQMQTLAILCVGAWLVMTTDQMTIGMLVAFQMFASR
ncbi:MAG: ABC transporter transmembrane domain-containing protein, partial [Gammaproteobacteria bacterium]